jgi:glycosyltransferase involved in cell wall biosynthesis
MSRHPTSQEIRAFISRVAFVESVLLKKDETWPRITVVTPSFNQGEYLERCILSVLNQNYANLEYVIIDGGSKDGSADIIRSYEKYLAYWVSEKDDGQSDAINKGFKRSSGELLAWLNSDDIYLPGALQSAAGIFRKRPAIDLFFGDTFVIDKNDDILREFKEVKFSRRAMICRAVNIIQPNAFWRRNIFFLSGMLRTQYQYVMDIDLWLRMLKAGARFYYESVPVAGFRIHKESKTSSQGPLFKRESQEVRREILGQELVGRRTDFLRRIFLLRKAFLLILRGEWRYVLKGLHRHL